MSEELFKAMREAVFDGDTELTVDLVKQSLEEGIDPQESLDNGLIAGILAVGEGFATGDLFIPDLIGAGDAVKEGADILREEMERAGQKEEKLAVAVIGTVKGDVHDLGKSLVCTLFSAGGYEVHDLGVDVEPQAFVDAVKEYDASILGLSSLLTSSMPEQKNVIDALEAEGIRDKVIVMIGGAPVTQEWADTIGADAFTPDAANCVAKATELLGSN